MSGAGKAWSQGKWVLRETLQSASHSPKTGLTPNGLAQRTHESSIPFSPAIQDGHIHGCDQAGASLAKVGRGKKYATGHHLHLHKMCPARVAWTKLVLSKR